MPEYKVRIKLSDYFETDELVIEADDWQDLCNKVFGGLEIIEEN